MTAFVWLLLAVCGIPVSAYRRESGPLEYPLQAKTAATATRDSAEKDAFALRCLNARGRTERNDEDEEEEKALQLLANLWNYTKVNIRGNITECKKAKKRKTQRFGEGFDVTCQDGRIAMLGLKKPAPVKISELEKAICRLPKLQELVLDRSNVTGSLEEVKGWTHLKRLHMRSCQVGGNLHDLRDLKKLKFLKLSGRNIQGSLHDLDQDFEILDLGHTSVTGNLSETSSRRGFRGLWLQNTSVSGDIMDILKKNLRLQFLHLSSTKVSGALCNPEQEEGRQLKELVLSNSLVTVCNSSWKELGEHVNVFQDAPFPYLTKLDVTGCNLAMDVWDFLSPLAKTCYHLVEVRAANCSLFGDLQDMSSADNRPMYWRISILDLSHNKITRLLGQARACWLDVSDNSLKTIDPSYFNETLLLDLRNTSYNASEEVYNVWELLEKEDFADQAWRCKGVRPIGVQENGISRGRVLVTPNKFASEELCICSNPDLERIRSPDLEQRGDCCACKNGTMRLLGEKNTAQNDTRCFACFGPGCNHSVCYEETEESKHCAAGYKGALCAACEKGYRCAGFARCKECTGNEMGFRIPLICFVSLCGLLMLCGSLWFWVWRDPDENTATERGQRFLELLEQFLLLLTFSQLLLQILSFQWRTSSRQNLASVEEGSSLQRFLKDLVMFDLGWFLDLLSVQCMLGYELGRNLEVIVVSLSLPVVVVFALALGFYKWGSPFYGLKYAIVVTSIGYQVTIQCTWGNLFWCETKSARGWDLGDASFLSQRPFIPCSDLMKDDLRYWLFAALAINGVVMPGGLCFLGMYISRRIKGVRSLSASLIPVMQCESNHDNVTLHFTTVQVAAEKIPLKREDLQSHVEFPSEVLWLYASAYVACIADSVGANTVEVMEAHFSRKMFKEHITAEKSLDLMKLKLTKGANFQELSEDSQEMALRGAQTEAHKLCKRLMYRTIGKHVTQREMKALWIGTRNSFERFGDKDPLLCEGLWKFFLLCMAKMCLSSEGSGQLTWIAIVMLATTVGISVTKPFGSRSRNDLATVCFGALFITSLACVALCVNGGEAKVIDLPPEIFKVLSIVPTVMVFLFFLHLQLMPGDILLQANLIQGEMKKCLGANEEGKVEEKTDQDDERGKKQEEDEEVSSEKPCVVPLRQPVLLRQPPEWTVKFVEWYRSLFMAIRN